MVVKVDPNVILDFFNEKISPISKGCTARSISINDGLVEISYDDPYKSCSPEFNMFPILNRDTLQYLNKIKLKLMEDK